ncbi:uncharacterized protein [Leuresthes tenuis]|uniref:uncharacterized protein n=1 Tax=Leuresthes tenuis TaxID=355514 RepID=UPI003B5111DE
MAPFCFPALHLLILLTVVLECRGKILSASKQEDVALFCLDSNGSSSRGRLLKYATDATDTTRVVFEWPKKSRDYKRVKFRTNEDGKTCLFIKNLQKSDAGWYGFEIWEGWDVVQHQNISLKIKDCKTLQSVKAAPGGLVKLICQENAKSGWQELSNVSWVMLKGEKDVHIESERVQKNGTFLAIQSVAVGDSGWYRCNYMLRETKHCSDINLHVQEMSTFEATTSPVPTVTNTEQALTVGETVQATLEEESGKPLIPVVALVVSMSLILAALAGLFIYRRCKTQSVTQQSHRQTEGSRDVYENLTLPCLTQSVDRHNSLYYCSEESMRTCKYSNNNNNKKLHSFNFNL